MTATLDVPTTTPAATPAAPPSWTRPALWALLAGTAVLYLWGLSGWANSFYSAAAQAGAQNWEAFFFGSSDAANSITVDKPPAAIWVMALSVRLFGLSSWSLLVPQALMGVASVFLMYLFVSRYFGKPAGLLAGAILATTPAATLMFRFNNPDALLVLLLVVATYAVARAIEHERLRWIVLAAVAVGFAFLTKSLQAFLVLPAFVIAVLVYSRRRVSMLLTSAVALLLAGGWWVAVVEMVPASARPYIGGSQTNSALELILGYNGLGRLTGDEAGSVGGGAGGGGWGTPSWHRMFDADWAGQIAWLLPAAFAAIAVSWLLSNTRMHRVSTILWGGWLLVTWAVFSFSQGIIHQYYAVALAPAIAALVAMAVTLLWRRPAYVGLAVLLGGSAVYGGTLLLRANYDVLAWVVIGVGVVASILLGLGDLTSTKIRTALAGGLIAAMLIGPTAFSLETASRVTSGSLPTAGPSLGASSGPGGMGMPGGGNGGPGGATGGPGGGAGGGLLNSPDVSGELAATLTQDASSYTWVAAGIGSQTAAGYQLATGYPVMAIGGFNGSDPSPTLEQFQQYVAEGKIHWFIAGGNGGGPGGMGPGGNTSSEISSWVQQNFESVTVDGVTLYDLSSG
ncbi:MAG: glycosyltransferase family 39 protein [Actinobacteria bacterium]|nr:glycosyltransferase family 39 protein [Actinomycetota bacterium]MCB8996435.1 glycosyltransferase family 39 protein [Actinomycetota bacterium]